MQTKYNFAYPREQTYTQRTNPYYIYIIIIYSLLLANVSGTVVGALAGKGPRMRLYTMRIEDLHYPAEVDVLHEIIDIRVPDIVAEHQQRLFYTSGLCKRDDQMA